MWWQRKSKTPKVPGISIHCQGAKELRSRRIVTVTATAARELRGVNEHHDMCGDALFRVSVVPDEVEFQYQFGLAESVNRNEDFLWNSRGIGIVVAEKDVPYLEGTVILFIDEDGERGFAFNNPHDPQF